MSDNNPYLVGIDDITMVKFDGSQGMSIKPQVIEAVVYQSIFSPILRVTLLMNDYVNLLNNYPMVGEETITLTLKQRSDSDELITFTMEFVVSAIKDIIVGDQGRQMVYSIDLVSKESFLNAKTRISRAYYDDIESMIRSVLKDYLKSEKDLILYDETQQTTSATTTTKKTRSLIIPNIAPFKAIKWLSKFAVSADTDKYYMYNFYEVLNGVTPGSGFNNLNVKPNFVFKAMQKQTYLGSVDKAAREAAESNPYFYVSNIEAIRGNKAAMENFSKRGYVESRSITGLKFNKRYSSLEKIIGGYFENEYIEVNMHQKDHKVTPFKVTDMKNTLYPSRLNTDKYIQDVISEDTRKETSGRLRYIVNNYDDQSQPSLRDKFGAATSDYLAYNSIDISVGIPTNLNVRPGDLIYIHIPETHGFNETSDDAYLTGFFMISEAKTVLRTSGETSTLLRVNKDSLLNGIFENSMFGFQGSSNMHAIKE
jgi:hypothetical protein